MSKSKCMNINIAGFRKTSLIDYPDHIATVIFTQGCNCRCPYCHNPGQCYSYCLPWPPPECPPAPYWMCDWP